MSMLWGSECDPYWSADLTHRSRLFICVEINSWCMLSSSIASAVFWVNSAQFFSGKSISMKQYYTHFSGRNPIILTFQFHICLGRPFSIQNLRKINFLKSDFSNFSGSLPLILILQVCISQVDKFTGHLTIKFSEYKYEWNCLLVSTSRFCAKLANGKKVTIGLTSACPFIKEFKFCR